MMLGSGEVTAPKKKVAARKDYAYCAEWDSDDQVIVKMRSNHSYLLALLSRGRASGGETGLPPPLVAANF